MFDIGFWELSIIGVVALIVIGPERLPAVAKTAGLWLGRMKRVVGDMKSEIDKELKADELKKVLKEQADNAGIHEIIEEGKSALDEVNSEISESENQIHKELDEAVSEAEERYGPVDEDDLLEEAGMLGAEEDEEYSETPENEESGNESIETAENETTSAEKTG